MSVIGPACARPTDNSPGCGCAAKDKSSSKVAGAATVTALAAAACTACCILPFTLPAAVLAVAGGSIAMLIQAHGWLTWLAVATISCAWIWIAWQLRRSGRPIGRTTLALMLVATLLTATAAAQPWLEPLAFHAFGIVKKKAIPAGE